MIVSVVLLDCVPWCLFRVTIMFVSFITVGNIFVFLVMASVFSIFPPTYPAECLIYKFLAHYYEF